MTIQASLSSGIEWIAGAVDVIDVRAFACVFEAAAENRAMLLLYLLLLLLFSLSLALALNYQYREDISAGARFK